MGICGLEKNEDGFRGTGKGGLRRQCKICLNARNSLYRKNNIEYKKRKREVDKKYREKNKNNVEWKNRCNEYSKRYNDKDKTKQIKKQYANKNKERIKLKKRQWAEHNKAHLKAKARQYYFDNKIKLYKKSIERTSRAKELAKLKRKSKQNIIIELKAAACVDCGNMYEWFAMDFDHIDGYEKCFDISRGVSTNKPLKVILEEIKKCELVCCLCHRHRTYLRNNKRNNVNDGVFSRGRVKRQDIVNKIKDIPCVNCKEKFDYWLMDFNHLPNHVKYAAVSAMIMKLAPIDKILEEVSKCEILCVRWHRYFTFGKKYKNNSG